MSLDERIQQLDQRIASLVQQAVSDFHKEIGQRLSEEVVQRLEQAPAHLPTSFVSIEGLQPLAEEAAASGSRQSLTTLRDALAALDSARSQADILNALLAQSRSFASRAAVFLTRPDGASGWGAHGFGEDQIRGVAVDYRDGGPWSRLAEGRSSIDMGAADCAAMAERLAAPAGDSGHLIPLVLRDRVAAALYVDHAEDGRAPQLEALQVLTYAASLAIETLPFRNRGTTPTLIPESEPQDSGAGLGLWDTGAVTAAAVAAQAPAAEAPREAEIEVEVLEEAEEPVVEAEPVAAEIEEAAPAAAEDLLEEVPEFEPEEAVAEPEVEVEPEEEAAPAAATWAEDDLYTPPGPKDTQAGALSVDEVMATAAEPATEEPAVEVSEFVVEDAEDEEDTAVSTVDAVAEPVEAAGDALSWDEEAPLEAEPEVVEAEPVIQAPSLEWEPEDEGAPAVEYSPVPDAEATPDEARETQVPTLQDANPADTVLLPRDLPGVSPPPPEPTLPEDEEPAAEEPAAEPPAAGRGALFGGGQAAAPGRPTQVAPPEDVEGPGRAFAGAPEVEEPGDGDEAAHEEARRLARLLVSEIKLYNEEQVDEGRRNGNIYEQLKEDIDRSRQMYEERTDERVRNSTDYFYQELVRLLAGGDAKVLGI